jgi:dolichyl-diphosphooligosaccharide--protein glycosyltransferase
MVTSGIIYHILRFLTIPVDIRNVCVLLAPGFSGLTALAMYLLTCEMSTSPSAGLLAAAFMGIAPGYISRSVAGSYDNEAIAIFLLVFTFFLWIKAVKNGSIMWGALTALFYGYMVSAWGGYVFITNLIPLHVFVLLCMGRYSSRVYISYTTWYALGTLGSMQIPFVGFLPIRNSDHMSALGVFGLIQLVAFADFVRGFLPGKQFQKLLTAMVLLTFGLGFAGLVLLSVSGVIAPWSGRFYSLWDTGYAKIHIPIIASVSEHQPTAWPAFFFDLNFLIWLFPAGVFMCFQNLKDEHVFVIIYAVLSSYFAGVMVRLMLTLTPIVCVAAALALSSILDNFMVLAKPNPESPTKTNAEDSKSLRSTQKPVVGIYSYFSKAVVTGSITVYLLLFVAHCTWVTSNAYSSPSVVLASRMPDGSQFIIDDYREAYYWLRQNTPDNAKIMSWWDYGYQIGGMADRPTLVDNNTWNNTHIATVGKAMSSREEVSYPILRQHDVDYVLVVFGGLLGYSGDDLNKFLWMVRIAEGIWPDEVKERDFFTARGEYRVDDEATPTMRNSLMYVGLLFTPLQRTQFTNSSTGTRCLTITTSPYSLLAKPWTVFVVPACRLRARSSTPSRRHSPVRIGSSGSTRSRIWTTSVVTTTMRSPSIRVSSVSVLPRRRVLAFCERSRLACELELILRCFVLIFSCDTAYFFTLWQACLVCMISILGSPYIFRVNSSQTVYN